jgi:hypothetical protein
MDKPANQSDAKAQLDAAAELDAKGRLRGHNVITKDDHLILVRPGTLSVAASTEKGVHIAGLKPGQRLASRADVRARRSDVNAKRKAQGKPELR